MNAQRKAALVAMPPITHRHEVVLREQPAEPTPRAAIDVDDLANQIASRLRTPATEGWLNSDAAAAHLGISRNALHKLTAARKLRFEQDAPGCKCWFRRSDLDAYRRAMPGGLTPPEASG